MALFRQNADRRRRAITLPQDRELAPRPARSWRSIAIAAVPPHSAVPLHPMGGWGRVVIAVLVAGSMIAGSLSDSRAEGAPPAPATACQFALIGAGPVSAVIDGRSFVLDDGREVRLAGIEVPHLPPPGETGPRAEASLAARAALAALIAGQNVELRQPRPAAGATDRYGRTLAHVYLIENGTRNSGGSSVVHELLAKGHARVAAEVGDRACAAEFLARERAAREAKLGLWGERYYAILEAESGAALLAERGRFTVVEGKVLSVRESGGTIYMNFGRRWSDALTVTVLKRHERGFTAAGLSPKSLENRRLRVRGFLDERNGPRIEATRPEQIEIAERN
jgi:endonuclease YncB( thermonuclease family)